MMKHLLIALAAAVMVSTAYARILTGQDFESGKAGFTSIDGDESTVVEYVLDGSKPGALYPFAADPNANYLSIDTGDGKLVCSNDVPGDVYFDMYMQFKPCSSQPRLDPEAKIAVYLDAATSNLVVVAANQSGATNVTTTGVSLEPDTWGRLTVAAKTVNSKLQFTVRLDGEDIAPSGTTFYSLVNDTTVNTVCFKGSGALDDFVARTTDPYFDEYSTYSAWVGSTDDCEKYLTYTEALTDVLAGTPSSISFTFNGATNQVDGSADYPYQIPDAASLKILANAVNVNPAVRSLNYVQTANINMNGVADFYGIGWFSSSTSFASVPSGVAPDGKTDIPFAGTYDGQGYTISNVTIVKHSYAGVFNNVSGCVKNLTVQDIGLSGTCAEWGCAIVGNAGDGSLLENLKAVTSTGFNWGSSANHNVAGIVVRPIGTATIRGCVNNANISAGSKRLGGIAAFVGSGSVGTVFDSCTNNATLVSTDGTRGVGGILGCAEGGVKNSPTDADTIIRNCADFGSETAQGSGGHAGAIVGSNWNESYTYTDAGGNTFKASSAVCGYIKNPVFGLAFATKSTIDSVDYLTTVSSDDISYTAGTTYYAVVAGDHTITAEDNTALNFNIDTNGFNSVITLDVPEGIAVNIYNSAAIGGVTVLTGSGRVVTGANAGNFQTLVKQSGWTGTLEVRDANITGVLNNYANANSTLCLNNSGFTFSSNGAYNGIRALEIGGNGAEFLTPQTTGTFSMPCALTGSGKITVSAAPELHSTINFTGDTSAFTGALEIKTSAKCRVTFGTQDIEGNGNCLVVGSDATVSIASGKTWHAPNGQVIKGTVNAAGSMTSDSKNIYGTGTVNFTTSDAATGSNKPASTWKGLVKISYNPGNLRFVLNDFGNANSTVEIATNFGAFPSTTWSGGTGPSIAPAVVLSADWTIANGWQGTDNKTTFSKLTGSGNLTVNGTTSGTDTIYYDITTLDEYTGTLGGNRGGFTIDKVNVATQPTNGAIVVKTNIGANGFVSDNVPLYVNGVDTGKTLKYKSDGALGEGLYVADGGVVVKPGTPAVIDESATNSLTVAIVRPVGDIELTSAELEAYQGLFKLTFSPGAETGKVNVGAELDETKTGGVVTSLNAASGSIPLATVAAGTDAEVTVNVVPGLFYGVSNGTSLQGMSVAADGWTQAVSGQTTVILTVPAQAAGSGSGFYRIEAVAVPPPTPND